MPLIGFSGSPFTLACYMIEGQGGTDFATVKKMLYQRPDLLHHILATNARAVTDYLNAQIEAGAQAVMIFDTWGGALSHAAYHEFSLRYMAGNRGRICKREHDGATRAGDPVHQGRRQLARSHGRHRLRCARAGLDRGHWQRPSRVGDKVALQGNLDPAILLSDPDTVRNEVAKVLASYGSGNGHVFNLGHGISQFTPPENAAAMVEAVHELSRPYHVAGDMNRRLICPNWHTRIITMSISMNTYAQKSRISLFIVKLC